MESSAIYNNVLDMKNTASHTQLILSITLIFAG